MNFIQKMWPEPLRFLHALAGTFLVYLPVWGLMSEPDFKMLVMFLSAIPMMWYWAFVRNTYVKLELGGQKIYLAYILMSVLTIIGFICLLGCWLYSVIPVVSLSEACLLLMALFLYGFSAFGITVALEVFRIFPPIF